MRSIAKIICFSCIGGLTACSGYVEDKASAEFAPVYPEATATRSGPPTGSIYHSGASGIFAVDRRASQVGDILTINLNESFAAEKEQTSTADRSDSLTLTLPNTIGDVADKANMSATSAQKFAGKGDAKQSNKITGFVTVSVVRVFSNGHLEVLGQKVFNWSERKVFYFKALFNQILFYNFLTIAVVWRNRSLFDKYFSKIKCVHIRNSNYFRATAGSKKWHSC